MYNLDNCQWLKLPKVKLSQKMHIGKVYIKAWNSGSKVNIQTTIIKINRCFINKENGEIERAILCSAESFSNLLFLSSFRRNRGASLKKKKVSCFTSLQKKVFFYGIVGFHHDSNRFYWFWA